MRVNLKMIKSMDMEYVIILMEVSIKANIKIIEQMDME